MVVFGFPLWLRGKESACNAGDTGGTGGTGSTPEWGRSWVRPLSGEDPLEKEVPTPVFLPGESHGHRSLAGYRP